jgi:uncharacterized protein YuzE
MPQISLNIDDKTRKILAVYFKISSNKIKKTIEISPDCYVDLDSKNHVVGAELLKPGLLHINTMNKAAKRFNSIELERITPIAKKALKDLIPA